MFLLKKYKQRSSKENGRIIPNFDVLHYGRQFAQVIPCLIFTICLHSFTNSMIAIILFCGERRYQYVAFSVEHPLTYLPTTFNILLLSIRTVGSID